MTAQQRRDAILDILSQASGPVSAAALAGRFSVSRQLIVGRHTTTTAISTMA